MSNLSKTGYVANIGAVTLANDYFRQVLFTGKYSQLVVMSLLPGEEIGEEVHDNVDQFFRIEKGNGKVIMNGEETEFGEEFAIIVPAGTKHNVINTGSEPLKLYTIYSPANHPVGTIHKTKEEAEAAEHE
jgi:mannose-6-phosphate isomerase-like protein (cupin superfamily)